jgi:AAA+ ATPase superfamily predicted ATPase
LYEEPVNLMKQEMREPAVYNSLIRAIADGASRQSDIANRVGELPSKVAVYLRALLDLEIVERVYPLGDTSKNKVIYRISDNLYAFWFKFIPRAMGMIEMGMSETAWTQLVQPYFSDYFGSVFETISRQYLIRLNRAKRLPYIYHTFGKWWGTNPSTHQQEEIDIVAESPQTALFAECKWTKEMVGTSVLDTLRRRSLLTQNGKDRSYYLFSRSGFSKELQHSTGNDVCLVKTEDILNINII